MRRLANELKDNAGKTVEVAGWLHKKRALGGLMFVILRDRTGLMQVVVESAEEQAKLTDIHNGSILKIEGQVKADPRAVGQAEIHQPTIEVMVPVTHVPPIEVDKPIDHRAENLDTLFENRVLNLRNLEEQKIFKIRAELNRLIRAFLDREDFIEIQTPKILAGATEGGAEAFKLDYFGQEATLAQSPQFYKQIMVGAFERVFEIAPAFRAEPSMTTRHLSEVTMLDIEMGFISGLEDVLEITSRLMNEICEEVWQSCSEELSALKATKPLLADRYPVITLDEVHRLYSQATGEHTTGERDLFPAEERWICEYAKKHYNSEAVFVTEFPSSDMKFYHKRSKEKPDVTVRADLIFRGSELATIPQREHRYDTLVEQIEAAGIDPNHPGFKYYLQAFKYGLPPHGGFGFGIDRLTQQIIGLNNVKEATLFPRDMRRFTP